MPTDQYHEPPDELSQEVRTFAERNNIPLSINERTTAASVPIPMHAMPMIQ